jgi:hypothetical protein
MKITGKDLNSVNLHGLKGRNGTPDVYQFELQFPCQFTILDPQVELPVTREFVGGTEICRVSSVVVSTLHLVTSCKKQIQYHGGFASPSIGN